MSEQSIYQPYVGCLAVSLLIIFFMVYAACGELSFFASSLAGVYCLLTLEEQ